MKIVRVKDYNELSKKASEILILEISKKPSLTVGFATGKTQLGFYKELVKKYKRGEVSFSKVRSFNLDEYYPIKKRNKKSFYYYMFKNLFNHIDISKKNINLLNGEAKNPEKECKDYQNRIRKNKIDIQFLGIGKNGHIAYNEPGSGFNSKTRLVKLDGKNQKALTIGIGTILNSKKIILLASGKRKAKAVKCMIKGKISSECPASFLRKHKNVIIIVDREASSLLN